MEKLARRFSELRGLEGPALADGVPVTLSNSEIITVEWVQDAPGVLERELAHG